MTNSQDGGLVRTLKDLTAGAIGGVTQVLVGQPFDIIKVRLQTSTHYANAFDCAKKIWINEGTLAFYKGTLTPLLGIGACVSIQFGAFYEARRRFADYNLYRHPERKDLTYLQYYLAGVAAGLANSVISGPIEHVRIRLQTQPHGSARLYDGPYDLIRKVMRSDGISGIYRGEVITLLREAQAYGVWFLAFEYLMNREMKNKKREEIPSWKIAIFGGLAGEAFWLASYPLDVVKSKQQSDGFGPNQRYKNMRDCFKQTWRAEGAMGFWRGIGPTLLRAMPVSAATFFAVEMAMRFLK